MVLLQCRWKHKDYMLSGQSDTVDKMRLVSGSKPCVVISTVSKGMARIQIFHIYHFRKKNYVGKNFQHLDEGKNLPGERNLYPFPVGSLMVWEPGLLPVEAVGEGATLFGSIFRWPLGGFLELGSID